MVVTETLGFVVQRESFPSKTPYLPTVRNYDKIESTNCKESLMPTATKLLKKRVIKTDLAKMSVRNRLLEYMAEGPHLSLDVAEQLRRDIREAKEEIAVEEISA